MTKYRTTAAIYFIFVSVCISAADVKQNKGQESTDIDFSFLENGPSHENWIDPFDMFEYKSSSHNSKIDNSKDNKIAETTSRANNKEKLAKDSDIDKTGNPSETEELSDTTNIEGNLCKDKEFIYLKRTANMILDKIEALKQSSPSSVLHVKLAVTDEAIGTLKAFLGSPCRHVQEFDSVISVLLNNAELTESYSYMQHFYSSFHQFLHHDSIIFYVTIFITILISHDYLFRLSVLQIIARLIILSLILSFAWNWCLLVKIETAKAHATTENTASSECHTDELAVHKKVLLVLSSIFFSSNERCEKYYEARFVDPVWKVSPLLVLSKTLSELFFHPLGLLGQHLGSFFQNLFSAVSWYLLVPVSFIVTISILLLLLMVFKYRIRFPFGLGAIEPGQQPYTREQHQLISDVLEGRMQIQRTDSAQSINANERMAHCSSCSSPHNCPQKTILQEKKKGMSSCEDKKTNIKELDSLSSLCYRLIDSATDNRIQNLEKVAPNCTDKGKPTDSVCDKS